MISQINLEQYYLKIQDIKDYFNKSNSTESGIEIIGKAIAQKADDGHTHDTRYLKQNTSHADDSGAYGKATEYKWGHTRLGATSDTAAPGNHDHDNRYLRANNGTLSESLTTDYTIQAGTIKVRNGTADEFLKADGSKEKIIQLNYNLKYTDTTSASYEIKKGTTMLILVSATYLGSEGARNATGETINMTCQKGSFSIQGYISNPNTNTSYQATANALNSQTCSMSMPENPKVLFVQYTATTAGVDVVRVKSRNSTIEIPIFVYGWETIDLGISDTVFKVNELTRTASIKFFKTNQKFPKERTSYYLRKNDTFGVPSVDSNGDPIITATYEIIPEKYRPNYGVIMAMYNYGTIMGAVAPNGSIHFQASLVYTSANVNGSITWGY